MRREGHIIEEIVEYSNIAESFDQVISGTKRKESRQGRYLLAHREEFIKKLSERIVSGQFHVTPNDIEEKDIIEAGYAKLADDGNSVLNEIMNKEEQKVPTEMIWKSNALSNLKKELMG